MASGPLYPDPTKGVQQDRNLVDRAQFVGSAGRAARELGRDLDDTFDSMLKEKIKDKERLDLTEEELEASRQAGDVSLEQTVEKQVMSDTEVELHNREESIKESKRRGHWMGPTPIIGLSVAGNPGAQMVAGVQHSEGSRSSASRTSGVREKTLSKADPNLLQALRTSGLEEPLTGLEDPRLAAFPIPLQAPWKPLEVQGGSGFVWRSGIAHQRLELREGFRFLESAAGTMIQTIEGHGGVVESRLEQRDPPDPNFTLA